MSWILRAAAALLIVAASGIAVSASDRVAIYGRVDRVVLEPSAEAPDTIQIFGVFSVAIPRDMNDYQQRHRCPPEPPRHDDEYDAVTRRIAEAERARWAAPEAAT